MHPDRTRNRTQHSGRHLRTVNDSEQSSSAATGSCPGDLPADQLAVIIVDHGSRLEASNLSLLDVVELFRSASSFRIVEPAHMEIANPTIAMAFDRCVQQGARFVVVHPYFLAPGKHWQHDIPQLVAEAARQHPNIGYVVSEPLGPHPTMCQIMMERIQQAISTVSRSP